MPRRRAFRVLLLVGLTALAAGPTVSLYGQPGGPVQNDDVTYRDRATGKTEQKVGEIKESAAGIIFMKGGKAQPTISPVDVIKVDYPALPGIPDLSALNKEVDPAKAQTGFADLLKKAGTSAPEKTRRVLVYREAMAAARVADLRSGDDFKIEAAKAADKLVAATKIGMKSWECWPAAHGAARLYQELGQPTKAAEVYTLLGDNKDLPPELQFEAKLAALGALLRVGQSQVLTVEGQLDILEKEKGFPTGPLKERLVVLRAAAKVPVPAADAADLPPKPVEALAKLEDAINQAKDPVAKAVGYNCLGDLNSAYNAPRDAMWAYLWVAVVYTQDKDELVYGVSRLVGVYDKLGDKDRADQFRDKLLQVR